MPDKPHWIEMVPEAIIDLLTHPEALVDRREVERLLDVKRRQAQRILQDAGATVEGQLIVISAGELAIYLDHVEGSGAVAREWERRLHFAEKLEAMRRERMNQGPLFVEVDSSQVRKIGYAALPPGVRITHGSEEPIRLVIEAKDVQDLLEKMALLACAMQGDGNETDVFPEFERLVAGASA